MAAKFLGQFLLEAGLIDRQQLLDALDAQRASNPLLGELAESAGMLDAAQAKAINERQRRDDKRFGDIAQDMGLLTDAQVGILLEQQKAGRKLFGEILIEQGALERRQLEEALQAHRKDREEAVQALVSGVSTHASGDVANSAMNTCSRLFPRLLKTQCQFSHLPASASVLAGFTIAAHVRIHSEQPLLIAIACDPATTAAMAAAFLSMDLDKIDDDLAKDAVGELVNVVMGYVVKDTLPADARYRAEPPDFGLSAPVLVERSERSLAVIMTSQIGEFALIVSRG